MTVSPFDWLEAGYFYYRPSDLIWEGNLVRGHYLDKGFNVKFIYRPKIKYLPNFAVGLDDFAGTGFFSREYMVSTFDYNSLKASIGVGWGKFVGQKNYKNPFSFVSDKFLTRPDNSVNFQTGQPTYNQWFRGDATLFGGVEYQFSKIKGLKIKLEYDPYDYFDFSANNRPDILIDRRKKDSNINFGISFPLNEFVTIDSSFIKGNTLNLNLSFTLPLGRDIQKKQPFRPNTVKNTETNSKNDFYRDLLFNLNKNNLLLQTAEIENNKKLNISISTSQYRNALRSSSYAAEIAKTVLDLNDIEINQINVSHLNAGIELNEISYFVNNLDSDVPIEIVKRNTEFDSGDPLGYLENEFQPSLSFPIIFSNLSPAIVSHIGNPEKFYFGGLDFNFVSEIKFSRSLILSSEINFPVYSNISDTISGPQSNMEHVRTDLLQYLKEDDVHITRMQLDYIWSPRKNVYTKITGGILENMYGGIGVEALYKPFKQNFYLGAEIFNVKKRSFDQRFDFDEYKTTTGHINFAYLFAAGVEASLSFGRYLAKDDGYTLDLSRRLESGFKAGIYFTRTNVSAELFGEGSFDKGFYFQMPLDLFSNQHSGNYSTFKLSPLTRDGGAKLIHEKDLRGLIYNSSNYELKNQWKGFLN